MIEKQLNQTDQLIDELIQQGIYKINDRHLFELSEEEIKGIYSIWVKE
ncbi:Fur-regulated basic protein FbpA [Shouchella miscanthi]|nr:Fur-regulated basic protein FbpA [Shouchella miscanthi]